MIHMAYAEFAAPQTRLPGQNRSHCGEDSISECVFTQGKTMNFMPQGHDSLKVEKKYLKLKDGDNKVRILERPIAGWLDWCDKRPYRYRPEDKPKTSVDPAVPMKAFWALYVWDYATEDCYVWEITQSSMIKSLTELANNEDWGDFTKYDIKIKKTGAAKDTKYILTPVPHKPLCEQAIMMWTKVPVNLCALYESKDPWTDLEAGKVAPVKVAPELLNDEQINFIFDQADEALIDNICSAYKAEKLAEVPAHAFPRIANAIASKKTA